VGPKEYEVGSEGIDQLREKVKATTKALISWQNDQTNAVENEDEAERVSGKKKKRGVNRTIYKNPPATDPKEGARTRLIFQYYCSTNQRKGNQEEQVQG
jgi:hypothetical protein